MSPRSFTFTGGELGDWQIVKMDVVAGEALPMAKQLNVSAGHLFETQAGVSWSLRGITSNERYVIGSEKNLLVAKQPGLGRLEALNAALIPIRKSAAWWGLSQDDRREIFEEQSHHTRIGLRYLPAIARRLHHCRDLGENEPFDFLTWFEYAPANEGAFNELLVELRASQEWEYVDREIDIRLTRTLP